MLFKAARVLAVSIPLCIAAADAAAQSVALPGKKLTGKLYLLPATPETAQWGWFNNAQAPVLSTIERLAKSRRVGFPIMLVRPSFNTLRHWQTGPVGPSQHCESGPA